MFLACSAWSHVDARTRRGENKPTGPCSEIPAPHSQSCRGTPETIRDGEPWAHLGSLTLEFILSSGNGGRETSWDPHLAHAVQVQEMSSPPTQSSRKHIVFPGKKCSDLWRRKPSPALPLPPACLCSSSSLLCSQAPGLKVPFLP